MTTTRNGRPLFSFVARFTKRDNFDRPVDLPPCDIQAVSEFQARKKAEGIAKKNNYTLISLGRK